MDKTIERSIDERLDGKTIEQVLRAEYGFSTRLINKLKYNARLLINDEVVRSVDRVKTGDIIKAIIPSVPNEKIVPVKLDFKIAYEDEDIIVVDKPCNMPVHPCPDNFDGTLANALCYYWKEAAKEYSFGAVNRIDKNTSGLLIVAKNSYVHNEFMKQMMGKNIKRQYSALVGGVLENDSGTIDAPIGRADDSIISRVISEAGKSAITHYEVIERYNNATLVKAELETGRTHQIRVHFNYLGHPLIGDWLYGGDLSILQRQALHSTRLEFTHPISGKDMLFTSELPSDIKEVIKCVQLP